MDASVFRTDPYSCRKFRSIADEPSVRLIVGGSGLSCNLTLQAVFCTESDTGTAVYHALHQICHKECCMLAESLTLRIMELAQKVAVPVLDSCHENRCDIYTLRRECIVCRHHVIYGDICRTHAKRVSLVNMTSDTHLAHHICHSVWTILLHQIGRNIVRTLCQSPFQGHCLAYPFVLVCTLRRPCGITDNKRLGHIHNLIAWSKALLHCQGIEERLDGRSHLTLALTDIIIFEVTVVRSSDICLHMSCMRLNCHKCSTKM